MSGFRLAELNEEMPHRLRDVVRESWQRAENSNLNPDRLLAPLEFDTTVLHEYRNAHPLAPMMPVIRKLLVEDAEDDSGLLIAVGDAMGRLLWVEGDRRLKSRAESMMFVEGSNWNESVAGTSAPGTALALNRAMQIRTEEHYNRLVHAWSCTAVPVHDPETGAIVGVIDITGGEQAVDRHTMPLMVATAHAVESELMLNRLKQRAGEGQGRLGEAGADRVGEVQVGVSRSVKGRSVAGQDGEQPAHRATFFAKTRGASSPLIRATLQTLGREQALLSFADQQLELTPRHSEIMTLLAMHPAGLSAERLAELLWGDHRATHRLRPEMVRLRKLLSSVHESLAPRSRPYQLVAPIELDAQHVMSLLNRGAHRAALAAYQGELLAGSVAPGIEILRAELSAHLRESLLSSASADVLMQYAQTVEASDDIEVWQQLLRLLPAKSPKRAKIVAHIEALEGF